jgi:hypothetical protein
MTKEQFDKIVAEHGGLKYEAVNVDKPTEKVKTTDRHGRTTETEQPVKTPRYKYVFNDGTTLTAVTKPDGTVTITDPGTSAKPPAPGTRTPSPVDKLESITDPNTGRVVKLRDPSTGTVIDLPDAKSTAPPQKSLVTINGKRYIYDPATDTTTPSSLPEDEKKVDAPKLPDVDFGARQPGQRTDLASIEAEANAFKEQLRAEAAAGRINPGEMLKLWRQYFDQNVKPKRDQVVSEINEYQAQRERERQEDRQRQQAQDARSEQARSGQLGLQREQFEYNKQQDALGNGMGIAKFGMTAGQNAVENYRSTMPYRVGPAFGSQFSEALNTISRGGGPVNFSADAFTYQMPDFEAMAQQGAARAIAQLKGGLGAFGGMAGPAPAVQVAPSPGPAPAPFPGDPNAAVAANDPQVLAWLQAKRG